MTGWPKIDAVLTGESDNGPSGGRFDAEWRARCAVVPCSITDAMPFVKKHYLHKRPAIIRLCLMAMCEWRAIGCVVYSDPPRECSVRYGGVTWELSRLYLLDFIPRNAETWLIGQSVKYIKKHHQEVQCLVSYADPIAGHAGTIYRAANWRYDGDTDAGRLTPRCDYYDARTGQKYGRKGNMPDGAVVERKPRTSKHRFVLSLRAALRAQPTGGKQ